MKYLLGYNVPRANQLHKMLYSLVKGADQLRWQELVMGLSWIAPLLGLKYCAVRYRSDHNLCMMHCLIKGADQLRRSWGSAGLPRYWASSIA